MKKKVLLIIGIVLIVLIALLTWFRYYTKSHSPAATASITLAGAKVSIQYCQPYKKGRLIFGTEESGALQPYGKYWRLGANEATLFSTNVDLMINDQRLSAGKYSVYAYPGKDSWQIVFNSDFDRWGLPEPAPEKDVVKTDVRSSNDAPLSEQFIINMSAIDSTHFDIVLTWDQTLVTIPITVAP